MTQRHNKTLLIAPERPRKCSVCSALAECRPYGKNGADVCYNCAIKDSETTNAQFKKILDQVNTVIEVPGIIHHVTTPNDPTTN